MYFVVYNYIFAGVGALTSVQISPCYFESVSLSAFDVCLSTISVLFLF
jgi:hypothetical protein